MLDELMNKKRRDFLWAATATFSKGDDK